MNETEGKLINREELYAELWKTPVSHLVVAWGVPFAAIAKAAKEMNVPRPDAAYWSAQRRGCVMEKDPLPAAGPDTKTQVVISAARKRVVAILATEVADAPTTAAAVTEATEPEAKVIPVHPLVRQTRRALTTDTYLHHGVVTTRSRLPNPLRWIEVSPELLERALNFINSIIHGALAIGGRFRENPEPHEPTPRLFVGIQPVALRLREVMKRTELNLTDEEKKKQGIWPFTRYSCTGTRELRLIIGSGNYELNDRQWSDSKRRKLEDLVPEILVHLGQVEAEGNRSRHKEEQRKLVEAERARLEQIERRKRFEESELQKHLVTASDNWWEAMRLRGFVRACERHLANGQPTADLPEQTKAWLDWARKQADSMDSIKAGYLRGVRQEPVRQGPQRQW